MPIANLILHPEAARKKADLASLPEIWSRASGVSSEHMTVNLLPAKRQAGARFDAIAFLYLPTLWSGSDVARLQTGLARAIAEVFGLELPGVQIVVTRVESGHAAVGDVIDSW